MSLTLQDEELTQLIRRIAAQRKMTPEQVIADALADHTTPEVRGTDSFWQSIRGMGDSGDPSTAQRAKEILRSELDDQEGWKTGNAPNGTH